MQKRSVFLYIFSLLAVIIGLWIIIAHGSTLQAPHDISGTWQLQRVDSMPVYGLSIEIQQSGQFVLIHWPEKTKLRLRLEREDVSRQTGGEMHLVGDELALTIGVPALELRQDLAYRFEINGRAYLGQRIASSFQKGREP